MKNYTRRIFLQQANRWTLGSLLAGAALENFLSCGQQNGKPNIIYILADDLGIGDLGCYGQEQILTPNIDLLAVEGMCFAQHYSGSPVCGPSRCCLMTGKHTGHATRRENRPYVPLAPDELTVAEVLKPAGYRTGVIGKWHLANTDTEYELATKSRPDQEGFDYWFGCLHGVHAADYYPEFVWDNGERYPLNGLVYTPDLYIEKALEFIQNNSRSPFFLYFPSAIPHRNNLQRNGPDFLQVPDIAPYSVMPWPEYEKKYAAMVTRLDKHIGQIMQLLENLNIADNTIIMFSSDNGAQNFSPHRAAFFNGTAGLRGYKTKMYEGGIRAPFVVRWRKKITAGTVSDHISAFWDLLPTAADLAGTEVPGDIDGISFLPTLLGVKQPEHEYLYWELGGNGSSAIRMGKWKAVRQGVGAPVELYNLETDEREQYNVADKYPDVLKTMKRLFVTARTDSKYWKSPNG